MSTDVRLNDHTVARRCACKGWLLGPDPVSAKVPAIVRQHQRSDIHRVWDRDAWIDANTAQIVVRRVK